LWGRSKSCGGGDPVEVPVAKKEVGGTVREKRQYKNRLSQFRQVDVYQVKSAGK